MNNPLLPVGAAAVVLIGALVYIVVGRDDGPPAPSLRTAEVAPRAPSPAAVPDDRMHVLSVTHGYASHQLVVSYYPVPMARAACVARAETEVRTLAANATERRIGHFSGGTLSPVSNGFMWESDGFSGARFRAVAECRPVQG
jgi:hypothetical protein